jgi:precorrin-6A/cobalt-precorrin-6A reductase
MTVSFETARPLRVLLLGGTSEAMELAARLEADPRVAATTSLAGRTAGHRLPRGDVRVGGFGGVEGLTACLREAGVEAVIDATHPFAATISRNAAAACAAAGVPRVLVLRPPWRPEPGDRWIPAADTAEAAALVPRHGRRVFLTVGRQELAAFAGIDAAWFLVRMIEPPDGPLPLRHHEVVLARGPFSPADEAALIARNGIDLIVSKNSGGGATYPKIAAARAVGIPVVMIARPEPPPGDTVADADAALAWLAHRLEAGRPKRIAGPGDTLR